MRHYLQKLKHIKFSRSEKGAITIFGLFIFLTMITVGGLAADYANAIRVRTNLQVAGDFAAHAALVEREFKTPEEARKTALAIARGAAPEGQHGAVIKAEDIRFGYWNPVTDAFEVDENSRDAVLVDTMRAASRSNSVSTFFLNFVGIKEWNVVRQSVFETYVPACLEEGMVAEVGIEIQSGNLFKKPYCVHSNGWLDFSNGNVFEPGTIVTMPEVSLLEAVLGSNLGLFEATRKSDPRVLRIVQRVQDIYDGIQIPGSRYYRSYITDSTPIILAAKDGIDTTLWKEGRIHKVTCTKPHESIDFEAGITLKNGVLVTNCILKLKGLTLENATLVTLSTAADSINSPAGLALGAKDECAPGGGAQLLTMGGVSISSHMSLHGGQIIAVGDINFTSHADGSWGASIISGGTIDANSHNTMRACNGIGMEDNFNAAYFRLAY